VVACSNGAKTTLSGTVYDPAGNNPLYNVIVYVPNAPLDPIKDGISCDKCGVLTSGSPIVTTLTDASGKFTLEDLPAGEAIPLVMQIGKWRRLVKVPAVEGCKDNAISDKNLTRLPRNRTEGDIPRIAVATGGWDQFECLLRKIGIDDSEFTSSSAPTPGRVNLFQGQGGAHAGPGTANAASLWADPSSLKKYDVMINACEGSEFPPDKPAQSRQNVFDYVNAGGRMFATHYHYYWIAQGPQPFPGTAVWDTGNYDMPEPTMGSINTSFPKGQAFADWLHVVGASPNKGTLQLTDVRRDLNQATGPAQPWITAPTTGGLSAVQHITFNTPIGVQPESQCGRVVFSDFHVTSSSGGQFPGGCVNGAMTPQEKALEFMLFDLSACILDDKDRPKPPR
jgi:hypothetical protein